MNELRSQQSAEATDELWSLANGPNPLMKFYSGYMCNGLMGSDFTLKTVTTNVKVRIVDWW